MWTTSQPRRGNFSRLRETNSMRKAARFRTTQIGGKNRPNIRGRKAEGDARLGRLRRVCSILVVCILEYVAHIPPFSSLPLSVPRSLSLLGGGLFPLLHYFPPFFRSPVVRAPNIRRHSPEISALLFLYFKILVIPQSWSTFWYAYFFLIFSKFRVGLWFVLTLYTCKSHFLHFAFKALNFLIQKISRK